MQEEEEEKNHTNPQLMFTLKQREDHDMAMSCLQRYIELSRATCTKTASDDDRHREVSVNATAEIPDKAAPAEEDAIHFSLAGISCKRNCNDSSVGRRKNDAPKALTMDENTVRSLHPFYHYRDYSIMRDPDPLTPLCIPGQVPNFLAKLHAILARSDLEGIITWLPHGRAWRVINIPEFESQVIPKYFVHAKYTSFIRQANGWGFRRMIQGPDHGAYYHERFLRGLPHLCKKMKRTSKEVVARTEEPDLGAISRLHPVPCRYAVGSVELPFTLKEGPRARVPITTRYCVTLPAEALEEKKNHHRSLTEIQEGCKGYATMPFDLDQVMQLSTVLPRNQKPNTTSTRLVPIDSSLATAQHLRDELTLSRSSFPLDSEQFRAVPHPTKEQTEKQRQMQKSLYNLGLVDESVSTQEQILQDILHQQKDFRP